MVTEFGKNWRDDWGHYLDEEGMTMDEFKEMMMFGGNMDYGNYGENSHAQVGSEVVPEEDDDTFENATNLA